MSRSVQAAGAAPEAGLVAEGGAEAAAPVVAQAVAQVAGRAAEAAAEPAAVRVAAELVAKGEREELVEPGEPGEPAVAVELVARVAAGRAERHHVIPELGAVSVFLRKPEDMERAIELLKMSYELALKQKSRG